MTLLELAERCEQAAGLDRELDWEICLTVWPFMADGDWSLEGDINTSAIPSLTASLDAAMTLVPEGWAAINQEQQKLKDGSIRCWASIDAWPASPKRCATPALALCAAALRARAGQQP